MLTSDPFRERALQDLGIIGATVRSELGNIRRVIVEIDPIDFDRLLTMIERQAGSDFQHQAALEAEFAAGYAAAVRDLQNLSAAA